MATEYERKRLENIRRNDEMMASLNVHAKASLLSAATKRPRPRDDSESFQKKKKQNKPETPIVTRKSLRTRGLNPDGLSETISPPRHESPARLLAPLPFDAAYCGEGSHKRFVDTILGIATKPMVPRSSARLSNVGAVKKEEPGSSCDYLKKEVSAFDFDSDPPVVKPESESPMAHIVVKKEEPGSSCDYVKKEVSGFDSGSDSPVVKHEKIEFVGGFDTGPLSLKPRNVARVVPERILVVKFLPCENAKVIAAGDKHGNVGFWDLDCENEEDDGLYLFHPHSAPVSSLVFQQNSFSRVISSSYDGLIRMMDVEKSVFDLVYSNEEPIFSLSQRPNDEQSLYFGEGYGMFNVWDLRAGKSFFQWDLHESRINSIDFNPRNPHVLATSSTDGTACLWDLRSMGAKKPKTLRTVNHSKAVHSAYFSPSGLSLATTSVDNHLGILSGANFEDTSMIYHDNTTSRWISTFRGVWGWDDSYIFVGNRSKGIDVISPKLKRTVKELHDPLMRAIPCRLHCHPLNVGMLAGSTAGGQVYVWTTK